jgi:hypothetical protein
MEATLDDSNGQVLDQAPSETTALVGPLPAETPTTDDDTTTPAESEQEPAAEKTPSRQLRYFPGGKRADLVYLPASALRPMGDNVRDWTDPRNIAVIEAYAAEIDVHSEDRKRHIRDPLQVIPKFDDDGSPYCIIEAGETRWRAVLCVEGKEYAPGCIRPKLVDEGKILLPCIQGTAGRSREERIFDQYNQTGRRPSDLEIAKAFKELVDAGMSQAEIAEKIHKPGGQAYVSQILYLVKDDDPDGWSVDPLVREALRRDLIKTTTVVNTYRDFKRSGGVPEEATKVILEEVAKVEAQAAEIEEDDGSAKSRSGRGQKRVTQRVINSRIGDAAVKYTRAPRAHNKVNFETFHNAIVHEARYSADPKTRDNMNDALKRAGFHVQPCLVDDQGVELSNAAELLEKHEKQVKRREEQQSAA